ncbi:MAG: hypothetical protein H7Y43_16665 [Akkermansiaceae bacterium]|nr:hypothetical protein [Verrucomicrobiales bacterium]
MLFSILFSRWRKGVPPLILVGVLAFASPSFAQTNASRGPSNRWLLILETSRAMQPRADAAQQLMANLVASGMNGQMLRGDTIGVWTFNDTLNLGQFPLQQWTPETSRSVGGRIYEFLQAQKNEKSSRLEKVIPEMDQLIKASEFITVVLVTDGLSQMRGTPYDAQINASFKEWQAQQKASQMPFLTLLRAEKGTMTHGFVNTPPFPLELPPLPDALVKPPVVEPKIAAVEKPKPAVVPSIILSGKKTPPVIEAPTPAPVEISKPETIPASPVPKVESAPSAELKPTVVPQTTPPVVVEKTPVVNVLPASNPSPPKATIAPLAKVEVPSPGVSRPAATEIETPVPIQGAITIQAQPVWKQKGFWIAAVAIFAFTLLGTFLVMRRPRHSAQASLITRSLDRDKR